MWESPTNEKNAYLDVEEESLPDALWVNGSHPIFDGF